MSDATILALWWVFCLTVCLGSACLLMAGVFA